jgi:hypothetical protein
VVVRFPADLQLHVCWLLFPPSVTETCPPAAAAGRSAVRSADERHAAAGGPESGDDSVS